MTKEMSSSGSGDHQPAAASSTAPAEKNVGLWSSAITASGVAGEQANKFLKLMGIKNAPAKLFSVEPFNLRGINSPRFNGLINKKAVDIAPVKDGRGEESLLKEEYEKQKKVMRDLDRQYEIARETTHMGRGLGLGFHQ
ncbi:unnamed protein product [Nippostrongylus brasiliensis]|uniref:SMAP domain-containing protein n=1 Tax=Nippostrongylus brasiliensis TaxID=27835 RepID=A0A0N4Y7Y8_NIPBR|nr:unnamed protein product [Nippostrongylus brasiliensis]